MPGVRWNQVVRLLGFLRQRGGQAAGVGDGQLLERFIQERDESAFELLLWRHGAMVLNVCRRLVPREEDAEDAFQATFLALVKKARSIRHRESLAGWLYRVAYRAALAARARAKRIAGHEKPAATILEVPAAEAPAWDDLRPILDEEVGRLPERLRLPLILCYLEGQTNEEAARQLGCPVGTVFSRLAKGRTILRNRLTRRGLTLSAGALATLLSHQVATASPAPALVAASLKFALFTAAGQAGAVSSQVASLTEGVLKAMFLKKLTITAALVLVVAFLAGGGGILYHSLRADPPEQAQLDPPAINQKEPGQKLAAGKTFTVQVIKPKPGGLERTCERGATIAAFESVDVVPQVSGVLNVVMVDIGSRVKKWDALAVIEAPDLAKDQELAKIALELARAKVEQQEAKVETAKMEVLAAEATIKARQAELVSSKSNQNYRGKVLERMKKLQQSNAVPREEVDSEMAKYEAALAGTIAAEAALEKAKAEKNQTLSRVRLAETALKLDQLQVRSAQVSLEKAELVVNHTRLTAPFDGVITMRDLAAGDVISAKNPRAVLKINRTDKMRLIVNVAETDAVFVHPGMPVSLEIDTLGNQKFSGLTVSRMASFLDRKTGTMRVEVDVPNPKGQLMEGMFGRASIKLGITHPKALSVPRSCIVDPGVFVVKDGKARFVPVRFGASHGGRIEVLSGLNADDDVVLHPGGLKDGAAVEIKKKQ
jgi:RNA polymerase sigma factor (sigma-70 family)